MSDPETLSAEAFKQSYETCRHGFGLYVAWFTFFVTLNFVAMGWMAKAGGDGNPDTVVVLIAILALLAFIITGLCSGVTVITLARRARDLIGAKLRNIQDSEAIVNASLPADIYTRNVWLMQAALVVLACVSIGLGWWVLVGRGMNRHPHSYMAMPGGVCSSLNAKFNSNECTRTLNVLASQGWKLVGGSADYSVMYFIKE